MSSQDTLKIKISLEFSDFISSQKAKEIFKNTDLTHLEYLKWQDYRAFK